MKKWIITVLGLMVGTAGFALGQSAAPGEATTMGRGRGGAPFAWNDKDKDGICDLTNKPVGTSPFGMRGRGRGQAARMGAGRGFAASAAGGWGRGMGRGMGNRLSGAQPQNPPAK